LLLQNNKTKGQIMATEIERKFLVNPEKWKPSGTGIRMKQAYLGVAPNPTVRVRVKDEKAYLTIKGRSQSISRPEFEYEVPVADALEMFGLAISSPVEKIRHEILHDGMLWEVDVFSGANSGLLMAEIELESEDQSFGLPEWIAEEVTGDERYYNSYLSVHPFQEWDL